MPQTQLEQCVSYFTQGGPVEWIAGGVTVVFLLITALTRANLPTIIKTMAGKVMEWKASTTKK